MPLSEHVYCVAVIFKMTEWVEQQICIKFCVKVEHSSTETIWMTQKAFGNDATSATQIKVWHKCLKDGQESIESDPPSGKWFHQGIFQSVFNSGRDTGRTVWGPKVPTLKGTEASLSYVWSFLYLESPSINGSVFHITWLIICVLSGETSCIYIHCTQGMI